jgi:hypothetical protein
MAKVRFVLAIATALAIALLGGTVHGQPYPTKVIRIVTSEPGGATDLTARLIAQGVAGPIGQPIIVENRGGPIVQETVAKAPPDGYTLLVSASMWITPLFQRESSWDPIRDFLPVTLATSIPSILVFHQRHEFARIPVRVRVDHAYVALIGAARLRSDAGAAGERRAAGGCERGEKFASVEGHDVILRKNVRVGRPVMRS